MLVVAVLLAGCAWYNVKSGEVTKADQSQIEDPRQHEELASAQSASRAAESEAANRWFKSGVFRSPVNPCSVESLLDEPQQPVPGLLELQDSACSGRSFADCPCTPGRE